MPPRAGRLALNWLKKHGVRVILGDRIEDWGGAEHPEPNPAGTDWILQTRKVFLATTDIIPYNYFLNECGYSSQH